jgi:hypothetical protein
MFDAIVVYFQNSRLCLVLVGIYRYPGSTVLLYTKVCCFPREEFGTDALYGVPGVTKSPIKVIA